jgi:drug/metabolite transporter (DMT)-like permease
MKGIRVWLAFALLSASWGSSYLFIRVGLRHYTPLSLVAIRLLIGAMTIGLIVAARRQSLRITRRQLATIFVITWINTTLPFLLISWGETTVPSGLASVLNSTVPIFSVLLAGAVLGDEPLTAPKVCGVIVGFGGVLLLLSRDLGGATVLWSHVAGQGAIVVASLCYAVAAVAVRRNLRGIHSLALGTWVLIFASGESVILSLIFSRPDLGALHADSGFALLWLGVLGSGLAYVMAFYILENWGAARYTLVAYMLPIVGLSAGAIFLHEVVDWRIFAGSALVISGVALASITRRAASNRAAPVVLEDRMGEPVPRTGG